MAMAESTITVELSAEAIRQADAVNRLVAAARVVFEVIGDEPCRLDHHGLCQEHHLRRNEAGDPECEVALLKAALDGFDVVR